MFICLYVYMFIAIIRMFMGICLFISQGLLELYITTHLTTHLTVYVTTHLIMFIATCITTHLTTHDYT